MIALLVKSVVQHGVAFAFALVLLLSVLSTAWMVVLGQELPTLITASTATIYYAGPLFVLYVNERLVAADRLEGTSEFLAALPLTLVHRLAVPWALGLAVVAAAFELCLLATALVASRREGLPLSWLVQIHVQVGLFTLAWHTLAFGVAHTGRNRLLVWWVFLLLVVGLEGSWITNPWRSVLWMAPLADPVEHTRSVPPWDAVVPVALWTLVGALLALALETWRGGALVARWYAPATARARAGRVVVGMVALGVSPLPGEIAPQPDAWSTLPAVPAVRAEVRAAGRSVEPIAAEVASLLDRIGQEAGVDRWPGVVLHPTSRGLHRHVRRAVGRSDTNLVLLVDPSGPRPGIVRDVVREVLLRQTGDLGGDVPGVDALIAGLPGALAPDPVLDARLAWVDDPAAPYADLRAEHGQDIAEAVAVARVRSLADRPAWVASVLGRRRGVGVPSLVAVRWSARGLPDALAATLQPGSRAGLAPPGLEISDDGVRARVPAGAEVVDLVVLDPLQPVPGALDDPRPLPVRGRDDLALAVDPRQAYAVRVRRWEPAIEGWVASAWVVR
ncbi:MAG: hypothetical protein H6736_15560 [Alphaproteobacteria bacterium]|nr:hypothetical protein [Alphaproteobacteria bacterium]MCB9693227.1 hypothetical protein [Alphaproteobacteria bacterium]